MAPLDCSFNYLVLKMYMYFNILQYSELLLAYRMCWEKFGWSSQKADELLLPVLKQYNKHEVRDFDLLFCSLFLVIMLFFLVVLVEKINLIDHYEG